MKAFTGLLLLATLAGCYGYTYTIPASAKHLGVCYYNGQYLPRGDHQVPSACQNIRCNEDGSILVEGCGRLQHPECTLLEPASLNKPYPQCCEMTYRCIDANGDTYTKQWNRLLENNDSDDSGETSGLILGLLSNSRSSRDVDLKKYEKQIQKDRKQAEKVQKLIKEQRVGNEYGQYGSENQYQPDSDSDKVRYTIQVNRVPGQDNVLGYGRLDVLGDMDQDDLRVGQIGHGKQVQRDDYSYIGGNGRQGQIGYDSQIRGDLSGYRRGEYSRIQDYLTGSGREGQIGYGRQVQGDLSGYRRGDYLNQGSGYGNQVLGRLTGYNQGVYENQQSRIQDYLRGYGHGLSGNSRGAYVLPINRYDLNEYNRENGIGNYWDQGYLSGNTAGVGIVYTNKAIRNQDDVRAYGRSGVRDHKTDYGVRGYKKYNQVYQGDDYIVGDY